MAPRKFLRKNHDRISIQDTCRTWVVLWAELMVTAKPHPQILWPNVEFKVTEPRTRTVDVNALFSDHE